MFNSIKRILIIKPSALGDIVHSLPFLSAIKHKFPEAKIDWVVAHGLHTFLENHPMINKLWVIKKDEWKKIGRLKTTVKEIKKLTSGLKKARYDVSIDLSGLLRSGLITFFSCAAVKIGFENSDEGSPLFYTHKIYGDMNIHAIDRYLSIAEYMGCDIRNIHYPFAPYDPDPEILRDLPEEFVIMSPSAGKPANRWQAEKFGELASRLDIPTIVIASAAEKDIADQTIEWSKGKAISLAGKTNLKELIALISRAKFFVCNDTGPMHIAAALDIPVFAIFGPANPVRTGPYGKIHTVLQKDMDCIPCYAKQPCSHFKCMKDLSVSEVFDAINERLSQT